MSGPTENERARVSAAGGLVKRGPRALFIALALFVRRIRLRQYGASPLDRLLRSCFPPRAAVRELDVAKVDQEGRITIPPEYVFFRGHFDGMPMLPGITQITEIVLPLARRRHPELGPLVAMRRVRFRRPVFPGDTLDVEVRLASGGIRFALTVKGAPVASGLLVFGEAA